MGCNYLLSCIVKKCDDLDEHDESRYTNYDQKMSPPSHPKLSQIYENHLLLFLSFRWKINRHGSGSGRS